MSDQPNSDLPTIASPGHAYNRWAFEPMLNQHFNRLRARLLNLADSSTRDKQQAEAMKGLVKDFVNAAYYDSVRDILAYARDYGVVPSEEDHQNIDALRSQSMKDILYEPDVVSAP